MQARRCRVKPEGDDDSRGHGRQQRFRFMLHGKIEVLVYGGRSTGDTHSEAYSKVRRVSALQRKKRQVCLHVQYNQAGNGNDIGILIATDS